MAETGTEQTRIKYKSPTLRIQKSRYLSPIIETKVHVKIKMKPAGCTRHTNLRYCRKSYFFHFIIYEYAKWT